jgi:hypothetical protein
MRSAWCGIILGVLASCSGKNGELTPPRCASDADCGMDFRCERAIDRPVVGMIPCPGERACTAASDCADVEVCAPSWQVAPDKVGCTDLLCGAPCSTGSCPDDATCGDAGSCELIPCDASPDSPACPEHWRCDPEAAKTENPGYLAARASPATSRTATNVRTSTRAARPPAPPLRRACPRAVSRRAAAQTTTIWCAYPRASTRISSRTSMTA